MDDLVELARAALAAKLAGEVDPQITFLRALARRVFAAARPKITQLSSNPLVLLLTDGQLSIDGRSRDVLAAVPLELLAARLEAVAGTSNDPQIREAMLIVHPPERLRPPI